MNRITEFARLHESGCFVLANPWSAGTARLFHRLGYKALGTTSAGLSFDRGLPDTPASLPLEAVLENVEQLVRASPLPLSADFQAGYAETPAGVEQNVLRCLATGVAGLSIEDASGDPSRPLFDRSEAIERVAAARTAIDARGGGVVLTGRCEAWLVGDADPLRTALDRLVAYADAGADCLYAPGARQREDIAEIVAAVAPKPVNVLMSAPGELTVGDLEQLGVRRVSVGSAFARVAWGAVMKSAAAVLRDGRFDGLAGAAPFAELNALFGPER